jgi:WD40 repeat protein
MSPIQVKKLHTLTGHRDGVFAIQPTGEPQRLLSAAGDGMVVLWDLETPDAGQLVAKLPNSIYALHRQPDTGHIIAGHNYDGIHVLDWKNKTELGSLQLTKAAIFDIQSLGGTVFVATGDGALIQVHAGSLTVVNKVVASEKHARTIAVSEKHGEVAVGYSDNFIRVFDLDGLTEKASWQAHENSVFTLRYTPDQNFLISGSRDARLKVWDARAGYVKAAEVVAHLYAINHLDFSPDGKHFVTCSMDKSIKVWDSGSLSLLKVIDRSRHAGHGTSVNRLLWTTFHDQLVSASDDRTLSVWNIIF